MDQQRLRSIVLWLTVISGCMTMLNAFLAQPAIMAALTNGEWLGSQSFGLWSSILSSFFALSGLIAIVHMLTLILFVLLVHRDLTTCERWVADERLRLTSGRGGRLADEPGAGAVGGPENGPHRPVNSSV